jgi:hypothetical protein
MGPRRPTCAEAMRAGRCSVRRQKHAGRLGPVRTASRAAPSHPTWPASESSGTTEGTARDADRDQIRVSVNPLNVSRLSAPVQAVTTPASQARAGQEPAPRPGSGPGGYASAARGLYCWFAARPEPAAVCSRAGRKTGAGGGGYGGPSPIARRRAGMRRKQGRAGQRTAAQKNGRASVRRRGHSARSWAGGRWRGPAAGTTRMPGHDRRSGPTRPGERPATGPAERDPAADPFLTAS